MPVSCSICLRDVQGGQAAAVPCGHVFDAICITQCLQQRAGCPICNHPCALPEVRAIYFTRTDNSDNVIFLQNKINQLTYELGEARKEIAYKLPNTQVLNEQVDSLKKINQLQDGEIKTLKAKLQSGGVRVAEGSGNSKKTGTTNVDNTNPVIERQAKEIKILKSSLEEYKKDGSLEEKYAKLDETQSSMDDLYREYSDYQDEKEAELEERIQRNMNCDEDHGNMQALVKERDEAIEKYENLRDSIIKQQVAKSKTNKPSKQQAASTSQQQPNTQQKQRPLMQQQQQQPRPLMQHQTIAQHQRPATMQQLPSIVPYQGPTIIHQQQLASFPPRNSMTQTSPSVSQQPHQQPIPPQQQQPQQQPIPPQQQQQGNLQWQQIYVAQPAIANKSKKRKQSNNPPTQDNNAQQQQQSSPRPQADPQQQPVGSQKQPIPSQMSPQYAPRRNNIRWPTQVDFYPPPSPIPGTSQPQPQQQPPRQNAT